jgi:uncharacterized protein with PhoU and TrkA domain
MNNEEMKKILEDLFLERMDMKKSLVDWSTTYRMYGENFIQLETVDIEKKEPITPRKSIERHSI